MRVGETLVAIRVLEEVYELKSINSSSPCNNPYTTPRQNPLEPPLGILDYSSYEWLQRRAVFCGTDLGGPVDEGNHHLGLQRKRTPRLYGFLGLSSTKAPFRTRPPYMTS